MPEIQMHFSLIITNHPLNFNSYNFFLFVIYRVSTKLARWKTMLGFYIL